MHITVRCAGVQICAFASCWCRAVAIISDIANLSKKKMDNQKVWRERLPKDTSYCDKLHDALEFWITDLSHPQLTWKKAVFHLKRWKSVKLLVGVLPRISLNSLTSNECNFLHSIRVDRSQGKDALGNLHVPDKF